LNIRVNETIRNGIIIIIKSLSAGGDILWTRSGLYWAMNSLHWVRIRTLWTRDRLLWTRNPSLWTRDRLLWTRNPSLWTRTSLFERAPSPLQKTATESHLLDFP